MRAVKLFGTEAVEVQDAPRRSSTATPMPSCASRTPPFAARICPPTGYTPGFELGTTLGHEFVGVVESAGDDVGSLAPGQRVVNTSMTSDGAVSTAAPAARRSAPRGRCSATPASTPGWTEDRPISCWSPAPTAACGQFPTPSRSEDAVFVADILPTGFLAVERASVGLGDVVAILGCGPVGLMAVICAAGLGRRVIAVDGIQARRELAESLGASAVHPAEMREAVIAATGSLGADAVIEASGAPEAMASALGLVRPQGVISVVGAHFKPGLTSTTRSCSRRRSR